MQKTDRFVQLIWRSRIDLNMDFLCLNLCIVGCIPLTEHSTFPFFMDAVVRASQIFKSDFACKVSYFIPLSVAEQQPAKDPVIPSDGPIHTLNLTKVTRKTSLLNATGFCSLSCCCSIVVSGFDAKKSSGQQKMLELGNMQSVS